MLHRFIRIVAFTTIVITLMFFPACGSDSDTSEVVETSENQEVAPVTAVSVDGTIVPIEDFDSQPTVLWFWAPN